MRLIWAAVVMLAVPLSADAGWQYAEFGMRPEEVVKASKGKARRASNPSEDSKCDARVVAEHQTGQFDFAVSFCFGADDRLDDIRLTLQPEDDVVALKMALESQYGPSESTGRDLTGSTIARWRDPKRGALVYLIVFLEDRPEREAHLIYRPIATEDSGL